MDCQLPTACCQLILAQVKLEDVFRATQENISASPGPQRGIALGLCAVALLVLLAVLHYRQHQQAVRKPVNHRGKLLKQITRDLPLKGPELRQLRQLAEEQQCGSPLVLLLCPSLLGKAAASKPPEQRRQAAAIIKKLGAGE